MTTRVTWSKLPQAPHAADGKPHKMAACTTFELRNYRQELEEALAEIPAGSPDQATLKTALAEVVAEQDSRRSMVGHP